MMTPQDIVFELYDALITASETVYDETVPKSLPANLKDFIVFKMPSFKGKFDYDNGSIYSSMVLVECYVKNKANGIKNTARINELSVAAREAVLGSTGFRASISGMRPESKQINDYHAQVLIFNIIN